MNQGRISQAASISGSWNQFSGSQPALQKNETMQISECTANSKDGLLLLEASASANFSSGVYRVTECKEDYSQKFESH